jgi:hypothetical protein
LSEVDILLPTYNRLTSLILTLSGVASQDFTDFHVIVSDQSAEPVENEPVVRTLQRIIEARGGTVEWHTRPQVHGIVEQRHFLLERSTAPAVLYLDDDVFMEPWVVGKLLQVLRDTGAGFVGAFPAGLSHRDDVRPHQQILDLWEGPVSPEIVEPGTPEWRRADLHSAANIYHVARTVPPGEFRLYKVAWIASCVMFDRQKLLEVGGYSFWNRLPRWHSGEEVVVQNLLMRRFGGCAILPSGTYYSQVQTTVLNEQGTIEGHALDLLPELIEKYAPESHGMPVGEWMVASDQ